MAPGDFIPAYLDPGLRGETFAALDDFGRYGQVGLGVEVGTLIWQALGERHGDVMANVLQQAHALGARDPGAVAAALGASDALILPGPGVIDLHRAWVRALPDPVDADWVTRDGVLIVQGDTLAFTLSTVSGPYTLVLQIGDDGVPVIVDRRLP